MAGVVPAIRVMAESLAAAHIDRVHGIVNGTTNYILTEADSPWGRAGPPGRAGARLRRGRSTEDVTGKDAAAKMAILARLAFNAAVRLDDVSCEGIERITPDDIIRKGAGPVAEAVGLGRADRRRRGRARVSGLPGTPSTRWPR